uniref:Coatomer subunit zeta n=1 Tax=Accipiter nisus TaxID=211598 RepID=A0A8B9MG92_9AVES
MLPRSPQHPPPPPWLRHLPPCQAVGFWGVLAATLGGPRGGFGGLGTCPPPPRRICAHPACPRSTTRAPSPRPRSRRPSRGTSSARPTRWVGRSPVWEDSPSSTGAASTSSSTWWGAARRTWKEVEKRWLLDNTEGTFLAVDEIVDGGVILESDPQQVIQRLSLRAPEPAAYGFVLFDYLAGSSERRDSADTGRHE